MTNHPEDNTRTLASIGIDTGKDVFHMGDGQWCLRTPTMSVTGQKHNKLPRGRLFALTGRKAVHLDQEKPQQ